MRFDWQLLPQQQMSEDRSSTEPAQRSWFERLSQALLGEPQDREQLVDVLRDAEQRNLLNRDALTMIEGVMQVSEMQVRDIMIPRAQMVTLDRDAGPEEWMPIVIESAHSRFPVIGDNKDEIVGILLAKDLLAYYSSQQGSFNMRDNLRPAVFIPESKRLDVLLKEFRANRNHMAIVVDEYGGVAGIVTIEDVLEQIVGEIEDEHDYEDDIYIMERNAHHATVKAITPIEDFNEHFSADFSDEEFDTIGGLILSKLGHLPKRGERVQLGGFSFKILRADGRRVYLIQVMRVEPNEELTTAETSDRAE